eukprot:gnl/TRDRNA2_/TRDRNA2_193848_c0_seq1.p1 gnl/TRDRNA2_/TRDRNA2_193848_c0~~gnl/TRDRNA2_/TRDRNA2_193848_c0_seq1.p1  ORF type:complete len:756 (+),score=189.67 gnl/TRDRNA2_/TRDRNA2_193848_c0_seq1:82-2349(+)
MPKPDKAALLKKQSANEKKKLPKDMQDSMAGRKAEKEEYDEDEPASPPAKAASNGVNKVKGSAAGGSNFTRAAQLASGGDDDDDSDGGADYAPEVKAAAKPKETAASKKKVAKQQQQDELRMLAEEQKAATKQRILRRLTKMLFIGFFLNDAEEKKESKPKKGSDSGKPKKNSGANQQTFMEWAYKQADNLGPALLLLAFTVMIGAARMGEEGYTPGATTDVNYYEALGLARDASIMDVRKAYKGLALTLHPDKNPDCASCAEKFDAVSKAYETLSNPESKKAYDERRGFQKEMVSAYSEDLTAENFEARVLRSNEIWFVQVMDSMEPSAHFHPVWEDVASRHQSMAKFGRLDIKKHRRGADFLPQRAVMLPVVFRFERGVEPTVWMWSGHDESGIGQLQAFIKEDFPSMPKISDASELRSWWSGSTPRILIAGPMRKSTSAIGRLAHVWAGFIQFGNAEFAVVEEALDREFHVHKKMSQGWVIHAQAYQDAPVLRAVLKKSEEVAPALQDLIAQTVSTMAPHLTVRNYQQLCAPEPVGKAKDEEKVSKTYCLVMVDADEATLAKKVDELSSSRQAYATELKELRESGSETTEEMFQIQPVQISTSTGRWPWAPAAANIAHLPLAQLGGSLPATFLIDMDGKKVATVKSSSVSDIYQNIAYEDLKLTELDEDGPNVARVFSDPESSLYSEVRRALTTIPGALGGYILLVVAVVLLPEFSLPVAGVFAAAVLGLLLGLWPGFCRRFVGIVVPPPLV